VIDGAAEVPGPFADWPVIVVDDDACSDTAVTTARADELHHAWVARTPVVVRLACDPATLRAPQREVRPPWQLGPTFELARERLQFLVWVNNWDLRTGEPIWWWSRKAERLGAVATPDGPGDVTLADGRAAFVDGGPRQPLDPSALGGVALVHRDSVDDGRLTVARHRPPTSDLAPDQLDAVSHEVGAARVIAPAGSGKTRVLTERLRHLVDDRGWERSGLGAVAFNRRAADEMRARTEGLNAAVRTLNSLGLAICNGTGGFALAAGRRPLRVIDEREVRAILDDLVSVRHAPNTDPYLPYLEGLRMIRMALTDPADAEDAADADGLADVFDRFEAVLADRGLVDFDGQLSEAVRILLVDPDARAVAQARCRHLLVDEFQDLTPVHLLLLRLLSAPAHDVFGVGDDDQVIYGFGGATPEFLLRFDDFFPGAAAHALEVNYRCPPAVVEAAKHLLSYNSRRIDKAIRAAPGRADEAGAFDIERVGGDVEALAIADRLAEWHDAGRPWDDMAVLARVNAALLPLQVTMSERGMPSSRPLDTTILRRTGIRSALAYLRIGLSPERIDPADLGEVVRRPSRRIARNVVQMLTRGRRSSLADIRRVANRLTGGDGTKVEAFADDLTLVVDAVRGGDVAHVLRVIRDDVGLGAAMDTLDAARREADRSTHGDDLTALIQAAALHPDPTTFETWLRDLLDRPADDGGVELSTIHRVKGQEWDGVVVLGVSAGLLPHRLASDLSEERRLLHVAITRGRRQVAVFADDAQPSPFVAELDGSREHVPLPGEGGGRRTGGAAAESSKGSTTLPGTGGGRKATRGRSAEVPDAPAALVEALKAWRLDVSRADKVPAYVVLSDAHLAGIAADRPTTLAELANCKGIGPTKLDRYGDEILAVLDAQP
jgi:DNA helicase-2/ATP-dependent DNA helicase PcrA